MGKTEKSVQYAALIANQIVDLFQDDCENFIDEEELQEGENFTHFIHALANLVPTVIYNRFTGANENNLGFNHIANQLCFQYSHKVEHEKKDEVE